MYKSVEVLKGLADGHFGNAASYRKKAEAHAEEAASFTSRASQEQKLGEEYNEAANVLRNSLFKETESVQN